MADINPKCNFGALGMRLSAWKGVWTEWTVNGQYTVVPSDQTNKQNCLFYQQNTEPKRKMAKYRNHTDSLCMSANLVVACQAMPVHLY